MRLIVVVCIALVASACGGDSDSPTAPSAPPVATPPPVVPPPVVVPPPQPMITNYAGRWSGNYIVEQCSATSGSMGDVLCSAPHGSSSGGIFQIGVARPIVVELAQNGSSVDGTVSLGSVRGSVRGSVSANQSLLLSGTLTASDATVGLTITSVIASWDSFINGAVHDGNFAFNIKTNVYPGDGVVRARLSNVRR